MCKRRVDYKMVQVTMLFVFVMIEVNKIFNIVVSTNELNVLEETELPFTFIAERF